MKLLREWWPIIVALITAVGLYIAIDRTLLFGFWPSFALSGVEADTRANLGALGDVMGGLLNPVLTFISIILLIQTVRISQRTLKQTEDSLEISNRMLEATNKQIELNRQELEETRKEIADSAASQREIAKTQSDQKRQSAFFEVSKLLSDVVIKSISKDELRNDRKSNLTRYFDSVVNVDVIDRLNIVAEKEIDELPYLSSAFRLLIELQNLRDRTLDYNNVASAIISNRMRWVVTIFAFCAHTYEAHVLKREIGSGRMFGKQPLNTHGFTGYERDTLELIAHENNFGHLIR